MKEPRTSGIYDIGCNVFWRDFWWNCDLWDDVLDLQNQSLLLQTTTAYMSDIGLFDERRYYCTFPDSLCFKSVGLSLTDRSLTVTDEQNAYIPPHVEFLFMRTFGKNATVSIFGSGHAPLMTFLLLPIDLLLAILNWDLDIAGASCDPI